MEWLFNMIEAGLNWLYTLIGYGLASGGEKVGDKVLPTGRPMDKIATSRRMSQDQTELYRLYKKLRQYEAQAEGILTHVCWGSVISALDPSPDDLTNPIVIAANQLCQNVLLYEKYFPLPEIDFTRQLPLGETWELTKLVRRCLAFYETKNHQEKIGEHLWNVLRNIFFDLEGRPCLDEKLIRGEGEEALFAVPLESVHTNIPQSIEGIGYVLGKVCVLPDGEPFPKLWKKYPVNMCVASGIDPAEIETSKKDPIQPTKMKGKSPSELVQMYLNETPFPGFFKTNLPFAIPLRTRYSHMHIVGGSGHGKTQTLQNLLLTDLAKVGKGERSVIVIDSQGDLLHNILKLEATGDILDRVVLIYPKDLKHPPALNLFDFGQDRLSEYSEVDREMLLNGAVSLYEYMFGAVLGADLTAKQGVIFGYLARLLLVVPGATITTLIDFLEDPEKVRAYLPKLNHSLTRRFFDAQFFNKSFDETRQQILYRIYHVMQNETIARMFQNPRNKVNIFEAMNRGSLILIHTAKDLLKQEGCEILGRFFIALVSQAAQERAAIPQHNRTPTFVYIDEAHDYFDENIENLLEQARKYQVGMILAHQHLAQFENRQLRASVATNTAIKLAGGLSEEDARALAANMGTTPEFLQSMRKYESEKRTEFASFVKDSTPHAIRLSVPLGMMEEQPKIHPQVLTALIRRNWELYCTMDEDDPPSEPGRPQGDGSPLGDPDFL
jgi:hypothetical protein